MDLDTLVSKGEYRIILVVEIAVVITHRSTYGQSTYSMGFRKLRNAHAMSFSSCPTPSDGCGWK